MALLTDMKPQGIAIVGATGSIGINTLDVISRHPGAYRIIALSAHRQVDRLFHQCCQFHPRYAVVTDHSAAVELTRRIRTVGLTVEVLAGPEALTYITSLPEVDSVMAAIVGAAGLPSVLAAAQAGKRILLANKESLVMAGRLLMSAVEQGRATLLPVDSEHNAIFQALPMDYSGDLKAHGINKLILTASGGPFRTWSNPQMRHATVEEACRHPNWVMGRKISIDSATLMNKGLEVIEAHWLFNAPARQIEVVIHPQSVIHSMVQYCDGSVVAQLGSPDMRTPIAHALAWPNRMTAGVGNLDFYRLAGLTFEPPDLTRFPCLGLAYNALDAGGDAMAVLNAANEVAVESFLAGEIRLTDIPVLVEMALATLDLSPCEGLDALLAKDVETRAFLHSQIDKL